jgi:hypothetical protein
MAFPALLGVGAKTVGKSMVKSGGRAVAGKVLGRGKKKQPGTILPGRGEEDRGKGGAIIKPKTSVISASKFVPSSSNKKVEGQEKTVVIKEKLTTIAGLLEGTLASKKKEETDKKKKEQQERRGTREAKLEKKPKTDGKLKLPSVPGMSFLDRIKQFIMNVLGGYLLYKLVEFAPLLTPILTGIMQVGEWLINFGGTLLNGLVTFIDLGYQAYDWTRDQVKNIFGEEGAKKFDDFAGLVNKLLNGVIIGAMVAIKVAEGAFLAAKIAKATAAISGTASAVTTGGAAVTTGAAAVTGGSAVTTGVTAGGVTVTTSGGAGVGSATGIGAGAVAGIIVGVGLLASGLGEGAFQLKKFGQGLEVDAKQRYEDKAWYDPRKPIDFALYKGSQFINFQLGLVGGLLDIVGAPFRYAIELLRYPFLSQKDKEKQAENLAKLDARVRENLREGLNMITLGLAFKEKGSFGNIYGNESAQEQMTGQPADNTSTFEYKKTTDKNGVETTTGKESYQAVGGEKYLPESPTEKQKQAQQLQQQIQGRQEGGQIKPLDTPKKAAEKPNYVKGRQNISQIKVDQKSKMFDTAQTFSKIDFFGPILASATKIMSGEDLAPTDYKSIGAGFNNLLLKGFQDGKLKSNLAIAYNDGGIVSADSLKDGPLASANFSQWVGDTFKEEYIKQKPKLEQSTKGKEKKKTDGKQKTAAQSIEDALKSMLGISDPEPEPGSTDGPGSTPTLRDPATGVPMTSAGQASGAVQSDGELVSSMGFSAEDWNLFRNTVAQIESGGTYDIAGGSGDHYDGRYQLGAAAKTDGARYAGVVDPGHGPGAREAFRKDAELQEKLFAGFTKANHSYLMRVPEYKDSTPQRKLQILGYAHNQGMGGAENWMKTGVVGADGFGTKGTKYTDSIAAEFRKKSQKMQFGGEVDGQQGIDKVPAMLTSGEFVMDKDSTMAIQTAFPGFLSAVNKAEGQKAVEILMNYASYNDPTSGEVVVIDRKEVIAQAPMQTPSTVRPAPSGSSINFKEILSFVG